MSSSEPACRCPNCKRPMGEAPPPSRVSPWYPFCGKACARIWDARHRLSEWAGVRWPWAEAKVAVNLGHYLCSICRKPTKNDWAPDDLWKDVLELLYCSDECRRVWDARTRLA